MRVKKLSIEASAAPSSSSTSSPTGVIMSTNPGHNVDGMMDHHLSHNPRSCILQIGVHAGRLCELANTHPEMVYSVSPRNRHACDTETNFAVQSYSSSTDYLTWTMADMFFSLWLTSRVLKLNIILAIENKLKLNEKKYPVELCKVRFLSVF
jgi:hypothetical protein